MRIFQHTYTGGGAFATIAWFMTTAGRMLDNIKVFGSGRVVTTPTGIELYLDDQSFPWSLLAFGYELDADECTIKPGTIRMHGIAEYPLTIAAAVTLTGSTEWVYAEVQRGAATGTAPTIAHSSTEPETTSTHLRIPLYKFTSPASGRYTLAQICNMGDVNLDTPIL